MPNAVIVINAPDDAMRLVTSQQWQENPSNTWNSVMELSYEQMNTKVQMRQNVRTLP